MKALISLNKGAVWSSGLTHRAGLTYNHICYSTVFKVNLFCKEGLNLMLEISDF